ncbi:MAG: hypothetical protein AB7E80_16760 [Hyphomicrobiaceae bacterium]
MTANSKDRPSGQTPNWLYAFCYALMGPACAINGAFIANATPAAVPYGLTGLAVAGGIGALVGLWPAVWLARRIGEGIREQD